MYELDKKACWNISYGLYIVSTNGTEKKSGLIVNTVFQVTSEPVQLVVSISKNNFTHDQILSNGFFGISILEQEAPMPFIGTWGFKSSRDIDKFKDANFILGKHNTPLVSDYAVSVMELKLKKTIDVGTHTMFIGEMVFSKNIKESKLLTYEFYQKEKKGKAPKNAPTYKGN
jgi:ferric-chelate reductase [NAD(P)H]